MSSRSPKPDRSFAACRRSEEHTSELQSQSNLVCRLLLEKKNKQQHSKDQVSAQNLILTHPQKSPDTHVASNLRHTQLAHPLQTSYLMLVFICPSHTTVPA